MEEKIDILEARKAKLEEKIIDVSNALSTTIFLPLLNYEIFLIFPPSFVVSKLSYSPGPSQGLKI